MKKCKKIIKNEILNVEKEFYKEKDRKLIYNDIMEWFSSGWL